MNKNLDISKKPQCTALTVIPKDNQLNSIAKAFDNDKDIALFFLTWLENGLNSTQAYLKLHPNVTYESATVLGSRMLGKVSVQEIMAAHKLGPEKYFEKLNEGLEASNTCVITTKDGATIDKSGPDHATRKAYHDKLGRILGIEKEGAGNNVAVQVNNFIKKEKDEFGI